MTSAVASTRTNCELLPRCQRKGSRAVRVTARASWWAVTARAVRVTARPDGEGVGANEHLAHAIADHERTASPSAHNHIVFACDQDREGEGPGDLVQRVLQCSDRAIAKAKLAIDQVGDDFGVGVALEAVALSRQFALQFGEVLDDAIMD